MVCHHIAVSTIFGSNLHTAEEDARYLKHLSSSPRVVHQLFIGFTVAGSFLVQQDCC